MISRCSNRYIAFLNMDDVRSISRAWFVVLQDMTLNDPEFKEDHCHR